MKELSVYPGTLWNYVITLTYFYCNLEKRRWRTPKRRTRRVRRTWGRTRRPRWRWTRGRSRAINIIIMLQPLQIETNLDWANVPWRIVFSSPGASSSFRPFFCLLAVISSSSFCSSCKIKLITNQELQTCYFQDLIWPKINLLLRERITALI